MFSKSTTKKHTETMKPKNQAKTGTLFQQKDPRFQKPEQRRFPTFPTPHPKRNPLNTTKPFWLTDTSPSPMPHWTPNPSPSPKPRKDWSKHVESIRLKIKIPSNLRPYFLGRQGDTIQPEMERDLRCTITIDEQTGSICLSDFKRMMSESSCSMQPAPVEDLAEQCSERVQKWIAIAQSQIGAVIQKVKDHLATRGIVNPAQLHVAAKLLFDYGYSNIELLAIKGDEDLRNCIRHADELERQRECESKLKAFLAKLNLEQFHEFLKAKGYGTCESLLPLDTRKLYELGSSVGMLPGLADLFQFRFIEAFKPGDGSD